jgi:thioredoxin 1
MSELHEINELNFDTEVLQSEQPFLLDFTATWCGPCKALTPVLEGLARETRGLLKVGKIDIDSSPNIASRFGIRGAPTLLVFQGGREIKRRVGAGNKRMLQELVGLAYAAGS